MAVQERKQELIRSLERCRQDLGGGTDDVVSSLQIAAQLRRSLMHAKWKWLAGALGAGFVTGLFLIPRAKPRSKSSPPSSKPSGLFRRPSSSVLTSLIVQLVRPAIWGVCQKGAEKWLRDRFPSGKG
ncbi:MAG: hypothetical protein AAF191_17670 [Verrucomicrobiota bacterium]